MVDSLYNTLLISETLNTELTKPGPAWGPHTQTRAIRVYNFQAQTDHEARKTPTNSLYAPGNATRRKMLGLCLLLRLRNRFLHLKKNGIN
jgi:hypothetical protein